MYVMYELLMEVQVLLSPWVIHGSVIDRTF